jgi:cytochrome c-type biogenesis protein
MTSPTSPFAFAIAFGAGVLSFLSPCVLPLVPGYLGYLSGTALDVDGRLNVHRLHVLMHALSFVLGFTVIFTVLGASVGLIGYVLVRNMPLIQKLGGIVLVVLGLHTLHLINIPVLNRTFQFDASKIGNRHGYAGSSLIGAIFAAGWTPCVGVVLSGILALAATSATVGRGALLLAFYSLGLGIPFLLSALGLSRSGTILRRLNQRAGLVEKLSGVFLVIMGLIVFTNVMGIMSAYFYRWFGSFL